MCYRVWFRPRGTLKPRTHTYAPKVPRPNWNIFRGFHRYISARSVLQGLQMMSPFEKKLTQIKSSIDLNHADAFGAPSSFQRTRMRPKFQDRTTTFFQESHGKISFHHCLESLPMMNPSKLKKKKSNSNQVLGHRLAIRHDEEKEKWKKKKEKNKNTRGGGRESDCEP